MKIVAVFSGIFLVAISLSGFGSMILRGQEQEENVRGAFLTTRPKTVEKSSNAGATAKPNRRRPRTTIVKASTPSTDAPAKNTGKKSGITPIDKTNDAAGSRITAQRIGLGLTLFTRDLNGLAVRADPTHEFHKGDRIRLLLETNADGFLYVFDSTNGGKPVMIYPNPELDEAGNFIKGHVPVELPSSVASEERLRWLTFDEHAGVERLYLVFSNEPLLKVPLEDDLIKYCRENTSNCPPSPDSELWAQLQKELESPVKVDKAEKFGKAQTTSEHEATTRGIGLSKDDPQPSLIMLKASSTTGLLVTTLDLIHK